MRNFLSVNWKNKLEGIELIEDMIEFISNQMLRCKKIVQELRYEMKLIIPLDIKFNIKRHSSDASLIEILNRDKREKKLSPRRLQRLVEKNCANEIIIF